MVAAALILLTCGVVSLVVVHEATNDITRDLLTRGEVMAKEATLSAELSMIDRGAAPLTEVIRAAIAHSDVAYARFVDNEGRVLAGEASRDSAPLANSQPPSMLDGPHEIGPWLWEFRAPVFAMRPSQPDDQPASGDTTAPPARERVGVLVLGVSGASARELRERLLLAAAALSILLAIIGATAASMLSQNLTGPLRAIAAAADNIASGDLHTSLEITSNTEIGVLARSFSAMVDSLRRSRRHLEESSRALEQTVRSRTETLEAANRELEDANRAKSEFLATVSHELRTPLHVILGYTAMIREQSAGPVTPQQQDLLDAIQRYSKQQLDLLTDVLDFARLQSGQVPYHVERFEIETMLREVERLFRPRLAASGSKVHLEVHVEPGTPTLETDRIKLQEIVRNLVDNAVKFTHVGVITIAAHPASRTSEVVVSVADTGEGIGAGDLAHIFEPFRQVGDNRNRLVGGVGLGLSIVQQLSEGLGGRCSVVSAPNRGSTFSVTIPLQLPNRPFVAVAGAA